MDMMKYCNYQVTPSEIEELLIPSSENEGICMVGIPDIIATDLPAIRRKVGSTITAKQIYDTVAGRFYFVFSVYYVDCQ